MHQFRPRTDTKALIIRCNRRTPTFSKKIHGISVQHCDSRQWRECAANEPLRIFSSAPTGVKFDISLCNRRRYIYGTQSKNEITAKKTDRVRIAPCLMDARRVRFFPLCFTPSTCFKFGSQLKIAIHFGWINSHLLREVWIHFYIFRSLCDSKRYVKLAHARLPTHWKRKIKSNLFLKPNNFQHSQKFNVEQHFEHSICNAKSKNWKNEKKLWADDDNTSL